MRRTTTSTPWGKADFSTPLARGVVWYSTPSHGGLKVTKTAAKKFLSPAAISTALVWGGSYWYEEDCAYAVPFLDAPELAKLINEKRGFTTTPEDLKLVVKSYNPEYFERKASGYKCPEPPKVGDTFRFDSNVAYGRDDILAGTVAKVAEVRTGKVVFFCRGAKSLPLSFFHDGRVSVVAS